MDCCTLVCTPLQMCGCQRATLIVECFIAFDNYHHDYHMTTTITPLLVLPLLLVLPPLLLSAAVVYNIPSWWRQRVARQRRQQRPWFNLADCCDGFNFRLLL